MLELTRNTVWLIPTSRKIESLLYDNLNLLFAQWITSHWIVSHGHSRLACICFPLIFWKGRINYLIPHAGLTRVYFWYTVCFFSLLAVTANSIIYILLAFAVCSDIRFKITLACFPYKIIMSSLLLTIFFCFVHLIHIFMIFIIMYLLWEERACNWVLK